MRTINTYVILATIVCFAAATAPAQTWHLDPQAGWRDVDDIPDGQYLLALSRIKQHLASGDSKAVLAALESVKAEHPDLAGGDLDDFIAAEKTYAKGHLGKAARQYKDFLDKWPDSALQPAVLERYFSVGAAFLQGQKRRFLGIFRLPAFDEGVAIMRDIADRSGNAPVSLRALQVTAENQERRKQFIPAYHTWAEISSRWPTGPEGRDALLRMARALHTSYDGPDYDAAVLHSAAVYFEDYIMRYPQIAEELNLAAMLTTITEQLAHKHYEVGFYYERAGNIDTAHKYYNEVIAQWPTTAAAQMSANRMTPTAPPAVKQTVRRTLFDATTSFLDSWFGVKLIFGGNESEPSS